MKKSSKALSRLLPRDGHLCGIHLGGCGKPIRNRADASVDHIFTKSFFKDREDSVRPKDYNEDRNCQPMHPECNKERGGQIYGFPLFTCSCHWLQVDRTVQGHVLTLHYRANARAFTFTVCTEKHNFVFRNPSMGLGEVEISSIWTLGQLPPGEKGITGKGHLGHALPRIAPEEVTLFNRLELRRIQGTSLETIEKFNRRMDPMRMQVHFESR